MRFGLSKIVPLSYHVCRNHIVAWTLLCVQLQRIRALHALRLGTSRRTARTRPGPVGSGCHAFTAYVNQNQSVRLYIY